MSDQAMCAHLEVRYSPEQLDDGSSRERWTCTTCGEVFAPHGSIGQSLLIAQLQAEVEELRFQLEQSDTSAGELRLERDRLAARVSELEGPPPDPPFKTDKIGVCWWCGGGLRPGCCEGPPKTLLEFLRRENKTAEARARELEAQVSGLEDAVLDRTAGAGASTRALERAEARVRELEHPDNARMIALGGEIVPASEAYQRMLGERKLTHAAEARVRELRDAALQAFRRWYVYALDLDGAGDVNEADFLERYDEEAAALARSEEEEESD